MQRWIKVLHLSILAGLVAGGAAMAEPPTTAPSASKPARPVRHGTPPELTKAVADLSKEASDFLTAPDSTPLRKASDYFKKGVLPDDVTLDDVVKMIDSDISGNPFQVAYVKWQLLSGVTDRMTPEEQAKLLNAYNDAPTPLVRFTGDAAVRNQIQAAVKGKTADDAPDINQKIDEQRKKIDDVNLVIVSYRDALYGKLPVGFDSLNAALRDAVARADASVSPGTILTRFSSDADSWLASAGTPQQASALLANFKQARRIAKGPPILGNFGKNAKTGKMDFSDHAYTGAFEKTQADDIEKRLNAIVSHPQQSTLHFKDK